MASIGRPFLVQECDVTLRYVVVSTVLLVGGLCAGDDKKDDPDKLQGRWQVVSMELDGEPIPDVKGVRVVVKRNTWTFRGLALDKVAVTVRADAGKSPKHLDLREDDGDDAAWPGIYKLEGDTLTFCRSNLAGGKRPTEFKGTPGVILIVCKRAGK